MNIKTADGKIVAVNVPESVKRFSELKVGDKLKATYNNNVIVRMKPAGEAAVDTADTTSTVGQTQGITATVRRMTASISDIDKSASAITLSGRMGGNTVDGSSILPCSIRSRWATGLTSPGTPISRSRWSRQAQGDEREAVGERVRRAPGLASFRVKELGAADPRDPRVPSRRRQHAGRPVASTHHVPPRSRYENRRRSMRSRITRITLIVGMLFFTGACASREDWGVWRSHSTHFASGDHATFSMRNNKDGSQPRVSRSDITASSSRTGGASTPSTSLPIRSSKTEPQQAAEEMLTLASHAAPASSRLRAAGRRSARAHSPGARRL